MRQLYKAATDLGNSDHIHKHGLPWATARTVKSCIGLEVVRPLTVPSAGTRHVVKLRHVEQITVVAAERSSPGQPPLGGRGQFQLRGAKRLVVVPLSDSQRPYASRPDRQAMSFRQVTDA